MTEKKKWGETKNDSSREKIKSHVTILL